MSELAKPAPMFPVDVAGAPTITLAGRPWAVPLLAHGQNRHVVPAIARIMPFMLRAVSAKDSGDNGLLLAIIGTIDEPTYDALASAAYWSLKRAYPGLAQAEFDEMPITVRELLDATGTILEQSGFFWKSKDAPAGEAKAAPLTTSTGTESSSASAAQPVGLGNTSS